MSAFTIVPLDPAVAAEVRSTLRTPGWGYPAVVEDGGGYGPCRTCLRTFDRGDERRILFTFDPFAGREHHPLPGPVYICAGECEPYRERDTFPDALRRIRMTLEGYGPGRELRAVAHVDDGQVEAAVERLLADDGIAYLHVRNTGVGCFLMTIERGEAG